MSEIDVPEFDDRTPNDPDAGQFCVTLPLMKSWEDADGVMRFEGVAASTSLDRQHERMTPEAIAKMEAYTNLDLLPSHRAGALSELGQIEKCWVDNDQFRISGALDGTSGEARRLYEKLRAGKSYGLSVGGRVLKAHWDYDEEAGRKVKYIDDVALDHIALCRPSQAANPDTYLTALAKAADEVIEPAEVPNGREVDGRQSNVSADSEEAAFARVGRSIMEACQKLWPFGATPALAKSAEETADTGPSEDIEALRTRIEQLSGTVEALGNEIEQLRKSDENEDEDEQIEPGRPQAIPGQTVADGKANTWKGVL